MKSVRISEICGRYFRNLYFENKQAEIRAIANENTVLNALIISIFSFEMAMRVCQKPHPIISSSNLHPIANCFNAKPIVSIVSIVVLIICPAMQISYWR